MTDKDLLNLAREQFSGATDASSDARSEADEDIDIYEGEGIWDSALRNSRLNDPKGARPCLTVSDLPPRVRQVTNEVRQNKPAIKIRPVDDNADIDTAEVFNGLFRHIEQQSMSDIAYETANFYQTVSGVGYFRLVEELSREEQQRELYIRPIPNPNNVRIDEAAMCPVASDARFAFITEDVPRKEFEREYGKRKEIVGWNEGSDDDDMSDWITEDYVKIAEWLHLEEDTKNYLQTEDGEMGETEYFEQPQEARKTVMGTRLERKLVCVWRKIIGNRILKTVTLPISYIPVIRVPGEMFIKRGKVIYKGVVRDSRDAVRMTSYMFSSYIESVGAQSKTPYVAAAGQTEGFEEDWANSNIENAPVLHYNPVSIDGTTALPAPRREPPPMASQGIIQGLVLSQQAMKDVTGMGAASLGQKGNETSGKAIMARQREGDVGTYHYPDNLAKAIRHLGRIGLQWIPKVYAERKVARIIGEDGETQTVHLNSQQPAAMNQVPYTDNRGQLKIRKIYNLGVGCYDVVTTVGPSYATKRVEAAEMMTQLFQGAPELIQVLGDIFLGNQDIPGAQRMAKRLKAMLPPQAAAADQEGEDAPEIPPQVQAQLQQLTAKLQEGAQLIQEIQNEKDQLKAKLESKEGEIAAKNYATQAGIDEQKIKSLADIHRAEIDAESREKIAGLQAQVSQMQHTMQMFMDAVNSAGAASPETPQE